MKTLKTLLFLFVFFTTEAQIQTIRADKYMIIPRAGLGSAYRSKFITDQVFARHRFYIGSDTSNYQNEAFDVTVNARFGAKIKLGTTYGNAGEYVRSGGSLVNPTWSKIQWTDIEGVPSSSNSWVKIPISGTANLGIGNTSNSPFVFGSGTTRVGEYNQYGELYGFTTLSVNSGYTSLKNYNTTGGGYALAVGGKATFGYHANMPDAAKVSPYYIDVAKRYSSDAAQIRLATYNGSGQTNVPDWTIQSGANNVFSIQKAGSPWFNADTTNSFYISNGRFNFGRQYGMNLSKFTFGGSMTIQGALNLENYKTAGFLQTDANGLVSVNSTLQSDLDAKVTIATAQNITGIKTFQHNTASYMGYFNNTNSAGKGVKFVNTGIFPAIEVWQDLGSTAGVQLWANGDGDFDGYLRSRYFQMSTGGGVGKIMQSGIGGFGSWVEPTTLPISTSTQTALDGKAGLTSNNNFTGTNLFLTPVFANSTSTSSFSSMTGEWVGSGNLATFRWRYNTKVGSNTVTWYPLNIDTNGWVGFGMTPTQAFEVLGGAKFNSPITATSIGASGAVTAQSFSSTTGANFATSSGNVGIGTSSPAYKLQVEGGGTRFQNTTFFANGSLVGMIGARSDWTGGAANSDLNIGSYSSNIIFSTNNSVTERMRLDANGNLGIGITSPTAKLHTYGATGYVSNIIQTGATNAGALQSFITGSRQYSIGGRGDFITGGFHIVDETAAAARFTINPSGNIGIGTTNPLYGLHVSGTFGVLGNTTLSGSVGTSGDLTMIGTYPVISMAGTQSGASNIRLHNYISGVSNAGFEIYDQTDNTSRMVINSSGNIGFGINLPNERIDVAGNIKYGFSGTGRIGNAFSSVAGWKHSIIGTSTFDGTNYITPSVGSNAISVLANDLDGFGFYASSSTGTSTRSTDPTTFESYQRLRIKANGNVGIGTTSPTNTLSVSGGTSITNGWTRTASLHANYPVLILNSTASSKYAGIGYDGSSSMYFWVNGSSEDISGTGIGAMTIKSSNGNVGIGIGTAEQKLHVEGLVKIKAYTTSEISAFTGMSIGTITMNSTIGLPVFYNGTTWKRFDGSNM